MMMDLTNGRRAKRSCGYLRRDAATTLEGHGGPSFFRSDQRWLVQSLERSVRSAFAVVPDFVTRESGDGETTDEIVIESERDAMKAGTAMMVVIHRALVVLLVVVV